MTKRDYFKDIDKYGLFDPVSNLFLPRVIKSSDRISKIIIDELNG